MAGEQQRLHLQRHGIGDQPAAGAQRGDRRVEHAGIAAAAADEDRIRRGRPASAAGAAPSTTVRPGTPKCRGIAADARGALGVGLDGDGAQRRIGQHPFDGDRAGAGADVPQQFAAPRRQRRQRQRADLALGDLAVMLEQIVGEARRQRQDARIRRCFDFDRHDVERIDRRRASKAVGAGRCGCARPAPPSASSTVSVEPPKPLPRQQRARSPPGRSRPRSAPGCGVRDAAAAGSGRAAGRAARRSRSPASAQPSRAAARLKAEGAGKARISSAGTMPRERRADAVQERIAGGQHADAAAAQRQHGRASRRRRASARDALSPLMSVAASRQMPLAAEDEFGLGDQPPGLVAETRRDRPRRCRRWRATAGPGQVRGATQRP